VQEEGLELHALDFAQERGRGSRGALTVDFGASVDEDERIPEAVGEQSGGELRFALTE
jgi:hypothetical protein